MKKTLAIVALAALFSAACGSATEITDTSAATEPDVSSNEVTVEHIAFQPDHIEVDIGTTVAWTNRDAEVRHTVTSGKAGDKGIPGVNEGRPNKTDGIFDGELDGDGATFTFTFDEPGTYRYFCEVHPVMTGTVIVE